MSRFLSECDVRWLREWESGRQKRMLLTPLVYESDVLGDTVIVPAGLVYDGQSIPLEVSAFVGHQDNEAGTVHDWLCLCHRLRVGRLSVDTFLAFIRYSEQAIDPGLEPDAEVGRFVLKEQADEVYKEILLLNGMHEVHAQQQYAALDFYGRGAYDSGPARLRIEKLRGESSGTMPPIL